MNVQDTVRITVDPLESPVDYYMYDGVAARVLSINGDTVEVEFVEPAGYNPGKGTSYARVQQEFPVRYIGEPKNIEEHQLKLLSYLDTLDWKKVG